MVFLSVNKIITVTCLGNNEFVSMTDSFYIFNSTNCIINYLLSRNFFKLNFSLIHYISCQETAAGIYLP